jgi:hypothetical protein
MKKTNQFIVLIFPTLLLMACNQDSGKSQTLQEKKNSDTIYSGNYFNFNEDRFRNKKLTIKIDNGIDGESTIFKMNIKSLIRITIPRFDEYQISLLDIAGAEITKIDTSNNYFNVIPNDSIFRFNINQDYGNEKVILFYKNYLDTTKEKTVEKIIPYNGNKLVGEIELKTTK